VQKKSRVRRALGNAHYTLAAVHWGGVQDTVAPVTGFA